MMGARSTHAPDGPGRVWLRRGLVGLYGLVGAVHLASPDTLMPIMPAWVPEPHLVILGTGLCEIAGALALTSPALRRAAGIGLALYALCVWPANIKQAIEGIVVPPLPDSWWYHGPRLAFQPVLIWAGLYAGGAIDWPLRRAGARRRPGRLRHEDHEILGSDDATIP